MSAPDSTSSVERVAQAVAHAVACAPKATPDELRAQINQAAQYAYKAGLSDGHAIGFAECRKQIAERIPDITPPKSSQPAA
ncbi:MAG: hypothetical protein ABF296_08190 [Oceanococcaceae bacterium]